MIEERRRARLHHELPIWNLLKLWAKVLRRRRLSLPAFYFLSGATRPGPFLTLPSRDTLHKCQRPVLSCFVFLRASACYLYAATTSQPRRGKSIVHTNTRIVRGGQCTRASIVSHRTCRRCLIHTPDVNRSKQSSRSSLRRPCTPTTSCDHGVTRQCTRRTEITRWLQTARTIARNLPAQALRTFRERRSDGAAVTQVGGTNVNTAEFT